MNRLMLVETTMREWHQTKQIGITAEILANLIGADRSNVSRDLNLLVKQGKCFKQKSRPVLFFPITNQFEIMEKKVEAPLIAKEIATKQTALDHFSALNPSLFQQIELGKSAILYPSHVMHVLILGETGVGKSMFAELLYEYGIEAGEFSKKAPFIRFNCADYASNPQLLMSQLFGSVKGAYTGADKEREGLLKQADKGILFLDEIHRLPREGQEMLFTYIDQGTFKPLGESEKVEKVNVMLIGATTESKETLLETFIRRIPIVIDLPNLQLRTIEERLQLFDFFTKQEVDKLGMTVKVSTNSIKSFLSYECKHNIGQLKTDIRIVFAKAYADYLTGKKQQMVITTSDLPAYINEGLFTGIAHRKMWSVLDSANERFADYQPTADDRPRHSIYKEINSIYNRLESRDLSIEDIQKEIEHDLEEYIVQHQKHHVGIAAYDNLVSFIPEELLKVIEDMIEYSEGLLHRKLSRKVHQALAIHAFNTVERIKTFSTLNYQEERTWTNEYPELYEVAKQSLAFLEEQLDIKIPENEANYFILFFSYDDLNTKKNTELVQVIVIAHGKRTASALSETANSLLRNDAVVAINAQLDEKPQDVYNELAAYIQEEQLKQDILLLVDMGSLMTFAKNLETDFNLHVKAIPLVSTMHVLEASRKAMMGYSLAEVYDETLKVNDYLDSILTIYNQPEEVEVALEISKPFVQIKPLAILSICMTGEGTAITIKELLEDKLQLSKFDITIIPLNFVAKKSVQSRIQKLEQEFRVICIVSTFSIDTYIPNFDLFNMMNEDGIKEINTIIQEEVTYRKMGETITKYYEIDQIEEIIQHIFDFNDQMELLLNTRFNTSELIGLSFHLIGMIIKDNNQEMISDFIDRDNVLALNKKFVNRIQQEFTAVFDSYFVNLDKNQLNYVAYNYLNIRH